MIVVVTVILCSYEKPKQRNYKERAAHVLFLPSCQPALPTSPACLSLSLSPCLPLLTSSCSLLVSPCLCLPACCTPACSLTISGSLGQCLTPPFWSQCSSQHYARTRQCSKPLPPTTTPHSHKPACKRRPNAIGFCSVRTSRGFNCSTASHYHYSGRLYRTLNLVTFFSSFFLNIKTLFLWILKGLVSHPWEISSFLAVQGKSRRGFGQKWGV